MSTLELIGWIGNTFVIISFLHNDTLKLRSYNLVGASAWLIYGIVANSYSIIFLNVVVISIQIFKISQILRAKKKIIVFLPPPKRVKYFFDLLLKMVLNRNLLHQL